jgi:hypothetical protein
MQRIFSVLRRLAHFIVLASAALLFGCTVDSALPEMTATSIPSPSRIPATRRPENTATRTPGPTATLEPASTSEPGTEWDYEAWLASRPRNMEAYGLHYDPEAKPILPPHSSVGMPIWQYGMPLQLIEGEPTFTARPTPENVFSPYANLVLFGCTEGNHLDLYCRIDSALLELDCESLYRLKGVYADIGPVQGLIGRCTYPPPDEDEPREDYFYRTGCAFRSDVGYLFYLDRELRLVKTQAELKELFVPIETVDEAINYAQLMTGLVAEYQLQSAPELLYFNDPIDATRVNLTPEGYRVYLFHYMTCLCEPWINSEVELLVTREGDIEWLGARPWSMTIGFSCAD